MNDRGEFVEYTIHGDDGNVLAGPFRLKGWCFSREFDEIESDGLVERVATGRVSITGEWVPPDEIAR